MKQEVLYIENKSSGHTGQAWIGLAETSKTGQTIYFNNKAFKKLKVTGISGNHFDIETGEEYWISGIKKSGKDRHKYGSGIILIDEKCIEKYKSIVDFSDFRNLKITAFAVTDKLRFAKLENEKSIESEESLESRYWDNNRKKLNAK
jgi:hypothetical protein